jgi:hypothetical protein
VVPLAGQEPPIHAPDVIEKPMLCMDFSFKGVGVKCRFVDFNLDYGYFACGSDLQPHWENNWLTSRPVKFESSQITHVIFSKNNLFLKTKTHMPIAIISILLAFYANM